MKIITIPHPTLRKKASPVIKVDKKLKLFIKDLEQTLKDTKNPQGVGLAATQVNNLNRIFATYLENTLKSYINPEIIDHSNSIVLGKEGEEPYFEGCLSIPGIYGPVPRYEWVELKYDVLENDELVSQTARLSDFAARVVQHELDHLNGVLFIDYTLQLNLPLYKENKKTKKFDEIDSSPFQYV